MNGNENSKNIPESNDFDWDLSETEIPETEKPSQKYQAKPDDQDEAEELIDALISKALGSISKSYNVDLEALSDSIFNEIKKFVHSIEIVRVTKPECFNVGTKLCCPEPCVVVSLLKFIRRT